MKQSRFAYQRSRIILIDFQQETLAKSHLILNWRKKFRNICCLSLKSSKSLPILQLKPYFGQVEEDVVTRFFLNEFICKSVKSIFWRKESTFPNQNAVFRCNIPFLHQYVDTQTPQNNIKKHRYLLSAF